MVRIEAAIASCPGLEAIADESAPRFIGPDQISGCSSYPTSSTGLFQKAKRIARLLSSNLEMFSYPGPLVVGKEERHPRGLPRGPRLFRLAHR
jgi:hypothetical protein